MSLFSLDNILLTESSSNNSIDIDSIGYIDDEINKESFVQEGYDFIIEMGRDYMTAEKTFLNNILESYGDETIITESYNGFFSKIKDIIKKFIEWIKKIFKQFVLKMNQLFNAEKYIKKHNKELSKFDSSDEFEFKGYNYTHIDDTSVPAANALDAFTEDKYGKGYLSNLSSDIYSVDSGNGFNAADDDTKKANATAKVDDYLQKQTDALNDGLEDFYDAFRGTVINKQEHYDSSEYTEELFMIFRDEESEPSSITIDHTYVMEAYRRFDKYKDTVKSIEKTQKDIVKNYEDLERYLEKMLKINSSNNDITLSYAADSSNDYVNTQVGSGGLGRSSDISNGGKIFNRSTYNKMNDYLKIQSSKVNQMCSIHTQAFTAKLEAAKDQFKQDKKILYKALNQILKHSNKS